MSALRRYRTIYERVAAAVRRYGVWNVATAVGGVVMRHGVAAALNVARADQPFPWLRQTEAPAAPAGAPDLDEDFALPAAAWGRRHRDAGDRPGRSAELRTLTFVVQGEGTAEAFERTAAAIRAVPGSRLAGDDSLAATDDGFHVFLRPGDQPCPEIAWRITEAALQGLAEVVTFDLLRRVGDKIQPLLLPGANPTLLRSCDYVFSRAALSDRLLQGEAPAGVAPRERILQWMDGRAAVETRGRWRHVGRPLAEVELEDDAIAGERRRAGRRTAPGRTAGPASVVICTRDKGHLTRQLVRRLLAEDPALLGEVVIISNNTTNPYALAALQDLAASPRVQVARMDEPFNFSRLSNAGARLSGGRGPLLFLNDDIVPVSEDWLGTLSARLAEPDVGAAGPLLLYPDERVQHAGMYLGCRDAAGHLLKGARLPDGDYMFMACAAREVSALTGAVLLTRRDLFEGVNGFDEQLGTYLQDVDYCLRLRNLGLVNVFEPGAVLLHMESASIREMDAREQLRRRRTGEWLRFRQRWGDALFQDPFHPRGFDLNDESLRRLAGRDDGA